MRHLIFSGLGCALLIASALCSSASAQAEPNPGEAPTMAPSEAPPLARPRELTPRRAAASSLRLREPCSDVRPAAVSDDKVWFRGPLAASYLAPPIGLALLSLTVDKDTVAMPVIAGLIGLAIPALVHSVYGDGSGALYTIVGIVGSIAVGALAGFAIGRRAPGETTREQAAGRDAAFGALLGYSVWAGLDIAYFGYTQPAR